MKNFVLKIKGFVWAFCYPPIYDLDKIETQLQELTLNLIALGKLNNQVVALIKFFELTSPLQDSGIFTVTLKKIKGKNYGQFNQEVKALSILETYIKKTGRDLSEINRTQIGEEITPDKIFLGGIFGLPTKAASYWLFKKSDLKQAINSNLNPSPSDWEVINQQSKDLVDSHSQIILRQIDVLMTSIY